MRKAVATKVGASVDTMSPTGSPACALTLVVKPSICRCDAGLVSFHALLPAEAGSLTRADMDASDSWCARAEEEVAAGTGSVEPDEQPVGSPTNARSTGPQHSRMVHARQVPVMGFPVQPT